MGPRADTTVPATPERAGEAHAHGAAIRRSCVCWMGLLGASVAVLAVAAVIKATPLLASTTATTTITQVGTATTFESAKAATAVTKVPAGTATGDVLLTFVETRRDSKVTCTSGAKLILDHSHGAGTRLAGCLTVTGQSIPSAVRVRISPRNGVTAVTMAFAGVDQSTPVDVLAASSSSTSPSVTMSGNDLVVFGLGSSGLAAVATAPTGAQLQATVNDSGTRSGGRGHALRTARNCRSGKMEPGALVASGCRHRGPARGAVDCGQPDNRLPDRGQPDDHRSDRATPTTTAPTAAPRHVVGRLRADEFSPRLRSKFHARVDDGSRILSAVVWDCSVVTAGDLV